MKLIRLYEEKAWYLGCNINYNVYGINSDGRLVETGASIDII